MSTIFPPMTPERREAVRLRANRERELGEIQGDHVCGECGGLLGMWHWKWGDDSEPLLACMTDQGHRGWRRLHGQAEAYAKGEYVSPYVAQIMERKGRKRMSGTDLAKLGQKGMLARIEQARFPQQLTQEQKAQLAAVALDYGLDPLMGELIPFQGRPYVSIDGRYRKAQETGQLGGVESRPATAEERKAWEIPEGDCFFRAEVRRRDAAYPFVGWGRVRKDEMKAPAGGRAGFRPLETNPQRMAEKRAEAQALRKAFSIPLPSAEFAGTPEEEPSIDAEVRELKVDPSTGEVIERDEEELDGGAEIGEPELPAEDLDDRVEPPLAAPKLTCVNDVLKAAHERYGLQPKQVYDILGIKSSTDVTDLEEAWGKVAAAQEG